MYPFVNIFGIELPTYGILMATAFVIALIFILIYCIMTKNSWETFYAVAAVAVFTGFAGAKLLSIITLFSPQQIWTYLTTDPLALIKESGIVYYGGLIAGIIGGVVTVLVFKEDLKLYANVLFTVIPLAHGIGRIGCFMAGCCYGIPTDSFWGVVYESPLCGAPTGIALFPIQLFEAAFDIVLFAVLLFLLFKFPDKRLNAPLYISCYAVERFIAEYFRYDEVRGFYFGLSTSQWISIALLLISIVLFHIFLSDKKKPEQ